MKKVIFCFCVALVTSGASTAWGGLFTDPSAFFDLTKNLKFEGFENTAPGLTGTSRVLDQFVAGPISGPENLEIINEPALAFEGRQSLGGAVSSIGFFGFNKLPRAIGFNVFGFGNSGLPNKLEIVLSNLQGQLQRMTLASSGGAGGNSPFQFFGVTSPVPFTTVEILNQDPNDFITVDAVYVGELVPEPASFVVWGMALLAGVFLRRALRRQST